MSTRNTMSRYDRLLARWARISNLRAAASLLEWDSETYMPSEAATFRGDQVGMISSAAHSLLTSKRTGRLIDEAARELGSETETDRADNVRLARRDFERATKLPPAFVAEAARLRAVAQPAWAKARKDNDFSLFQPHLAATIALARKKSKLIGGGEHPYDALVDEFEPGATTAQLRRVFAELRAALVPMIRKVSDNSDAVSAACLQQDFPVDRQEAFSHRLMRELGLPESRSRLDKSEHPFTSEMGSMFDVRITSRYAVRDLAGSIGSTIHESGHAKYELGIPEKWARQPLGLACSLGMHESQSRLWENHVGLSRAFWNYQYPRLQAVFPEQLGNVGMEEFYRAINKSQPSFVRTESDELTYNLHIILRFEIELDLIEGKITAEQLPTVWKDRFEEMFGIRPPTDTLGVLQDIHWCHGMFGYFPTYTLGNLIAAQLFGTMLFDIPTLPKQVSEGSYRLITTWLGFKVHQYGRMYDARELVRMATKRELSADAFIGYLDAKYGELYGWRKPGTAGWLSQ